MLPEAEELLQYVSHSVRQFLGLYEHCCEVISLCFQKKDDCFTPYITHCKTLLVVNIIAFVQSHSVIQPCVHKSYCM